jgi:hypothetical protein
MNDLQGLGTTTRYATQFMGRKGWMDWTMDGDGSLESAKKDRDRLVDFGERARIVEIITTVNEYCD